LNLFNLEAIIVILFGTYANPILVNFLHPPKIIIKFILNNYLYYTLKFQDYLSLQVIKVLILILHLLNYFKLIKNEYKIREILRKFSCNSFKFLIDFKV